MVSIDKKLAELRVKRENARQGGGLEKLKSLQEKGKLTARERIFNLLDPGSFEEIDVFRTGCSSLKNDVEAVITGYGTVNGRKIFVAAQDFSVMGGSLGKTVAAKICKVFDLALKTGAPFVTLNDSGGARIQEGVSSLEGYGELFKRHINASGVIPQIAAVFGPCAGGAVYSPALADFTFMTEKDSYMFLTGPKVVKAATHEDVNVEELGGASLHVKKSGVADNSYANDEEVLLKIKELLSYLPQNNMSGSSASQCNDDFNRMEEELNRIVPFDGNKGYNVKDVIRMIFDNGEFFELKPEFASNIVTCLAKLDGRTVGVIANQPNVLAGVLDSDASVKSARFIRFCDSFNIPVITFVDVPGFLPGQTQEAGGIIRHGAKLLYAYGEATVPKISVIMRKAYGGAYIVMGSKYVNGDISFAWPTAEIAVMGPRGAVEILHRKELDNAADKEKFLSEHADSYAEEHANPYVAASKGYIDDIIEPRTTRPRLIKTLEMLLTKREDVPVRKHGNMPL